MWARRSVADKSQAATEFDARTSVVARFVQSIAIVGEPSPMPFLNFKDYYQNGNKYFRDRLRYKLYLMKMASPSKRTMQEIVPRTRNLCNSCIAHGTSTTTNIAGITRYSIGKKNGL